jgi:hypothetical protein
MPLVDGDRSGLTYDRMKSISTHRLCAAERDGLDRDGFVVREHVFSADEVAAMIDASEALVDDLVRDRQGMRLPLGSYVFDPDFAHDVIIKWEGDTDIVHGVEPLAHLSPVLHEWALDPRFVEPMVDIVGDDEPVLFTEKLNLKRPHHGGPNPPHQDYPYWVDTAVGAKDIATAMVFLDDATVENGCLRVAPGSHRSGPWTTRTDGDAFLANEIDMTVYRDVDLVPLELEAGSVVMFGAFLVHQSLPNESDRERRSLLFSYQPAGREHSLESLRRLLRGGS